jgi:outer membrane receptor protein involved in Fe transport
LSAPGHAFPNTNVQLSAALNTASFQGLKTTVIGLALGLAGWPGWSGSFRMRAINHYRLDGDDPSIVASGLTAFDLGMAKQLNHTIEFDLSLDNLLNRDYYETQNYFESRVTPDSPVIALIHATPAYPLTAVAGITLRFRAK